MVSSGAVEFVTRNEWGRDVLERRKRWSRCFARFPERSQTADAFPSQHFKSSALTSSTLIGKARTDQIPKRSPLHGALIEGTPINLDKAPSILLDSAQFFAAITAEKPAAVFSWQSVFNVDEWPESELEAAGWDEDKVGDEDGYWPSLQQAKVHLKPQLAVLEK
jgi:hypothetical protein